MNLKKITSLTMLLSMAVMTYTGIILFIAPPGRIANWANWEILALTKEQYGALHSTMMVLFIIATILHLYYNWKPITNYMKNSAKEMIVFTKDMVAAFFVTTAFVIGTLAVVPPFSSFTIFGEDIKESWEKEYGTAPYSHAELSSLKGFCKKLGYDLSKSEAILKKNNINYEVTQSLSLIGKENGVSPQFIYNLLQKNLEKEGEKSIPLTGLGKKQIKDVAETLGITDAEFIKQLQSIGITAQADDKFKVVVEEYDMSPMDVLIKLGYKKSE
jgi:uncharacterized membrane protein (Fun14 family)